MISYGNAFVLKEREKKRRKSDPRKRKRPFENPSPHTNPLRKKDTRNNFSSIRTHSHEQKWKEKEEMKNGMRNAGYFWEKPESLTLTRTTGTARKTTHPIYDF